MELNLGVNSRSGNHCLLGPVVFNFSVKPTGLVRLSRLLSLWEPRTSPVLWPSCVSALHIRSRRGGSKVLCGLESYLKESVAKGGDPHLSPPKIPPVS